MTERTDVVAEVSDGELARRIAAAGGAPAAEEEGELCRRFASRLVYFGRRLLGSEDLAQDALLLTLQKLRAGLVREPERIGAFVLGVARTLAGRRREREARSEPHRPPGALSMAS